MNLSVPASNLGPAASSAVDTSSSKERKSGADSTSKKPAELPQKKQTGGEALGFENSILKKSADFIYHPDNHKITINNIGNLIGAIPNLFGALNSITGLFNISDETSEKWFGNFSKISTVTRGITGAVDCFNKRNLIPLVGSLIELPVAFLSSGYNLWLARGIPQSIRQIQAVIKRREMTVELADGKKVTLGKKDGDDFSKYGLGFIDGFKASIKELGNIFKEIGKNPFDFTSEGSFSKNMLGCSTLQFIGPIISLVSEKAGAFIRDTGGMLVDFAYMTDKDDPEKKYFKGGVAWIGSAICDYAKRFVEVDSFKGFFNHMSMFLDPIAAIFESQGNFSKGNETSKSTEPQTSSIPSASLALGST